MLKKTKITITPKNDEDKEKARLLEAIVNWNYKRYEPIIEKLVAIRVTVKNIHGIDLPMKWFEDVIAEVVKMDLEVQDAKEN